jgi:hypothetical protein
MKIKDFAGYAPLNFPELNHLIRKGTRDESMKEDMAFAVSSSILAHLSTAHPMS